MGSRFRGAGEPVFHPLRNLRTIAAGLALGRPLSGFGLAELFAGYV
jgi:hypothetical protein